MPTEIYPPEPGRARVWSVYPNHDTAEKAVVRLEKIGIPTNAISMIIGDGKGNVETTTAERADLTLNQSVATGATMGGVLGTAVGAAVALAAAATIPGAILLGPLAGAVVGAGAGGITGGVMGTLASTGVPHDVSAEYAKIVEAGGVAVIADVPEHLEAESRRALEAQEQELAAV